VACLGLDGVELEVAKLQVVDDNSIDGDWCIVDVDALGVLWIMQKKNEEEEFQVR